MWLWKAWFSPDSFYSYCVVVPFISGIIAYFNFKAQKPLSSMLFPAAFLLFMFPLPDAVTAPVAHHLKYLTSDLAAFVLNLIQIPSIQSGYAILMPQGTVVVNDACSGIRAIISLLAMGSVFAYYMDSKPSLKALLILLVFPIAILTNTTRIVFLAIITEFWGAQYTTGTIHEAAGLLIYGLAFFILLMLSQWFHKFSNS